MVLSGCLSEHSLASSCSTTQAGLKVGLASEPGREETAAARRTRTKQPVDPILVASGVLRKKVDMVKDDIGGRHCVSHILADEGSVLAGYHCGLLPLISLKLRHP